MIETLQVTLAMLCLLASCSLSQEKQSDGVKEEIDREVNEMLCADQKDGGGFGASVQTCKPKEKKRKSN